MAFLFSHLISVNIFFPLVGAVVLLCLPARWTKAQRGLTLIWSLLGFVLTVLLYRAVQGTSGFELAENVSWVPSLGIQYFVAVDGVSAMLMLLTGFLLPICVLAAWDDVEKRVKFFHVLLLMLQCGMLGVFAALDAFLFYVFWEVVLIPMYFLIGIWGSSKRVSAAMKFVLYTMVGSVLMLAAIVYAAWQVGGSFNVLDWYAHPFGIREQMWLFAAFALAFAIKVPMFPLHTWLPDAHTEAPTVGSVLLAGVLLKLGTYGFYRFALPLFPLAVVKFSPLFLTLAVIGIVYGALVAMVQPDLKRLVAYSSVSHLGFVMLGLFSLQAEAVQGAVLQMINHGLSTGGLFLLIGMIYHRRHTRLIADFGGIAKVVPWFASALIFMTMASIGLPGLNGFVGEFLILLGSFQTKTPYAVVASLGVVLAAAYLLWALARVLFGKITHEENRHLHDLSWKEIAVLLPLIIGIIAIGVYPKPWLDKIQTSTKSFLYLSSRVEHFSSTGSEP